MHTTDRIDGCAGTSIRKVALVLDRQTRPETTGFYCRRALETLADVQFFHPSKLAEVPRSGFDLYLNIDDGMRYLWPADLRPAAWWAIDTHIDFEWCLEKAKGFDLVFAAQRDGAALLRREGVASARWLPLACDAEIHGLLSEDGLPRPSREFGDGLGRPSSGEGRARCHDPHPSPEAERHRGRSLQTEGEGQKLFDICFVGNLVPGPRVDLVRLIQQHFKSVFVGQKYFEEMAGIYSASRTVFNRSVANDVNMRVFEALASGSLLITNDLSENGQAELFRDGVHLATCRDGGELLDKLRYYLRRGDVREKIAAAGREEALAKHTYRQRMEEILRCAGNCKLQIANCKLAIESSEQRIQNAVPLYYDFARPEVLELIPATAKRVLEIGCGAGRLGEALKQRQPCEVVGVELNEAAARKAGERLDRVFAGNVERLHLDFENAVPLAEQAGYEGGRFDCLVCADVLEHLADPAAFLRRARAWLADDAAIVASLPNARHHSVVGALIEGNWTYEPAGLLDNTHLHFFTRRDVEELFAGAGYQVDKVQYLPGPGYDEWQRQEDKTRVQVGRVVAAGLPREEAEEFFVYQFLVAARPYRERTPCRSASVAELVRVPAGSNAKTTSSCGADRPHPGPLPEGEGANFPRCLLLMVTYNRLEYTRLALEAALKLDYPKLRVVVWDNASTDGTVDYLHERLADVPWATLIASPVNRGVVFPMNEVWSSDAEAGLLAKIDNDTLVPRELLRRLAECHRASPRFGVLSGFHFRQEGEALADEHRIKSFDGVRVLPQPYVGGCAVMIRREVFDRVGPIGCLSESQQKPFMDSGWTVYQQRLTEMGFVNGYPWPPVHVDHMEDTRSAHCVRSEEHQRYKREQRGMELEEFTRELCVWRPNWEGERT